MLKINYAGVEFQIAPDGAPPKFIFGVRKSGSSIMNSMLASVSGFHNANYVDVAGKLFEKGVKVAQWQRDPGMAALIRNGNVYGGFRDAPLGMADDPIVNAAQNILMVRDPRDALVSEYFSNAFTHSIPAAGEMRQQMLDERKRALQASTQEFVVKSAPRFRETLLQYTKFIEMPGTRVYRYEDAIMDKRWFLQDASKHFGWPITSHQIELIMQWADVIPKQEAPTEFVRKVVPGDHKDKCNDETIEFLNKLFDEELRQFGYV